MNCESWPSCNSALLSFIIPNRFRFVNESGSFFREIHFAPAARRWLALPFSGAPGPSRPTNAALFSASGHGLVIIPFSRSDATALCKPGCAGLVPGLGIDFLPYVKTRRFVFPQMGPEKGGELPGKGQRVWKFSGGRGNVSIKIYFYRLFSIFSFSVLIQYLLIHCSICIVLLSA